MLAEPGTARVRRATAVFVSTLILAACGEGLTGPVDREVVPPALSAAPVVARTTACQGGSASGFACDRVDLVAQVIRRRPPAGETGHARERCLGMDGPPDGCGVRPRRPR